MGGKTRKTGNPKATSVSKKKKAKGTPILPGTHGFSYTRSHNNPRGRAEMRNAGRGPNYKVRAEAAKRRAVRKRR